MFGSFLSDRRSYPRLECSIPLRITDYHFEWEARGVSLSNGGVFVDTRQIFSPGQDIEVTVVDEEFGQEVALESQVRWCRAEGLGVYGVGVAFLERRAERLEILTDLVDRLAVADVTVAARFRAAAQPMPMHTVLYVSRAAPRNPTLTDHERAFLGCVDGNTSLTEIQGQMTQEEFAQIAYAPFSLMAKGVLTQIEGHGIKKANHQKVGSRQPVGPMFISGGYSRKQVQARNAQAQSYYQQALAALQTNNQSKARTLLALALQLAPGDAEISAALDGLVD